MKKDLIITIFGSTGDLTARKLLPAITQLYETKRISQNVEIIALGRKSYDTTTYLKKMQELTSSKLNLKVLSKIVTYFEMQITESNHYQKLCKYIKDQSDKNAKHIYYLAIGPDILPDVAKHISESNLIKQHDLNQIIAFEKPFGHDLESAIAVNQMLWQYFDEKQIYRIDHYLGKDMIQNLMTIRYANRIFEDIWDNKAIKEVKIVISEEEGILNRAGYYDVSGALKDMVQSHLLQMLSLIAMDIPAAYDSKYIKDEKVKVLKSLSLDKESVLFGQYKGYLDETNIPKSSKTETFIYFKAFVNTPRFRGVPFHLYTGKKLAKKEQYIEIEFLPTLEQEKWQLPIYANKLLFKITPDDGVDLIINSKEVGLKENIVPISLSFDTAKSVKGNVPEAYEKLLLDMSEGHKTLFTRWDEIEASWQFIDEIKKEPYELVIYENEEALQKHIKMKKESKL